MFFSSDNFISPGFLPDVDGLAPIPSTATEDATLDERHTERANTGFLFRGKTARAIAAGIDIAIDFATLGEYRVVSDAPAKQLAEDAGADGLWATGIEWTTPDRSRATCSLPRARNRDWAMTRVRG
jgi:hypothetical protein